jgi:hypothetical protein
MTITRADSDHVSRRFRDEDDLATPPAAREARQPREPRVQVRDASHHAERVEGQPPSTDYLAFISHVAAGAVVAAGETTRDAAVQAKLDAVRDAFSGPYVVGGEAVVARPMFRMTPHVVPKKHELEVDTLGARAGVSAPYATRVGQGKPGDLVKITQALIDAARLPSGPGDVASRIRKMQWDYGIGVDCAGYSKQALAACSARVPKMYAPGMENFRDVERGRDGTFARVSLEKARPGDLITLDAPKDDDYGHNVVVYSHVTADDATKALLCAKSMDVADFLASSGPHHVLEVDSSWGAGADGAECGGYRRDTWIYDASSKTWGSFTPGVTPAQFVVSPRGPAEDVFHGVYRPRP